MIHTKESLLAFHYKIEEPAELVEFAAEAAAGQLAANWSGSINDYGVSLESLALNDIDADIDAVIELLKEWKAALLEGKPRQED